MALPAYPGRLYAGNAAGQTFLDGTVSLVDFAGPPLVCCTYTAAILPQPLPETFPPVPLVQAFAARLGVPLVFLDLPTVTGLAYLTYCFGKIRDFFTMSHVANPVDCRATTGPPLFSAKYVDTQATFAGVFMTAGMSEPLITFPAATMWTWATGFNRTTQFHRFGCGLQAASTFDKLSFLDPPDSIRAPLYRAGPALATDLDVLYQCWTGVRDITKTQIEAVQAQQIIRPGIDLLTNPVNVPYVYLAAP